MSRILINGQRAKALWNYDGKIEALPGSHVDEACRELVVLAAERGEPVTIEFNGTSITATGKDDPTVLLAAWSAEVDRKSREYLESAEYKAGIEAAKIAAAQRAAR